MKKLASTICFILFYYTATFAQTFNVTCNGLINFQVNQANLNAEAGNSLAVIMPTLTSDLNAAQLSLNGATSRSFEVEINRQEIAWNPNIQIWARRTGSGQANNLTGGDVYQQVNLTPNYFYEFRGSVSSSNPIPMQFELRFNGNVDPGNYQARIVLTVTQFR